SCLPATAQRSTKSSDEIKKTEIRPSPKPEAQCALGFSAANFRPIFRLSHRFSSPCQFRIISYAGELEVLLMIDEEIAQDIEDFRSDIQDAIEDFGLSPGAPVAELLAALDEELAGYEAEDEE